MKPGRDGDARDLPVPAPFTLRCERDGEETAVYRFSSGGFTCDGQPLSLLCPDTLAYFYDEIARRAKRDDGSGYAAVLSLLLRKDTGGEAGGSSYTVDELRRLIDEINEALKQLEWENERLQQGIEEAGSLQTAD